MGQRRFAPLAGLLASLAIPGNLGSQTLLGKLFHPYPAVWRFLANGLRSRYKSRGVRFAIHDVARTSVSRAHPYESLIGPGCLSPVCDSASPVQPIGECCAEELASTTWGSSWTAAQPANREGELRDRRPIRLCG